MKYNPGFQTDQELVQQFTVRRAEFEMIVDVLKGNTGQANQHVLVIGPRGSGKTTLARRVAAEVRLDQNLEKAWRPLVFGEEAYEVGSPGEFWLEALFHLAEQCGEPGLKDAYNDLRNEMNDQRLHDRCLGQLMDYADREERRLLLVVENLNMLLGEQMPNMGDWTLRHTLQNEPRLMLLGTATSRFDEIENVKHANFELFQYYDLPPLNQKECMALWHGVTGNQVSELQIRPLQILTGGNPRLLTILAGFAVNRSFNQLMSQLIRLIDDHTDYFKSQMESLSAQERKVFAALLDLWDPATTSEIAHASRLSGNKVSSLLNRLKDRGAVTVLPDSTPRKKYYQAAERLYNIYYLMRRRGHPSQRVRAAVTFMTHYYQGDELREMTRGIIDEALHLEPGSRETHFYAFAELLKHDKGRGLIDLIPEQFLELNDCPEDVRKIFKWAQSKLSGDLGEDHVATLAEMETFFKEIKVPDEISRAIQDGFNIPKTENVSSSFLWCIAGALAFEMGEESKAKEAFFIAIEHSRDDRDNGIIRAALKSSYNVVDPEFIERVRRLNPPSVALKYFLVNIHADRGEYEEAVKIVEDLLKSEQGDDYLWGSLGNLLENIPARQGEASAAYKKSVTLGGYGTALTRWISLNHSKLSVSEIRQAVEEGLKASKHVAGQLNRFAWGLFETRDPGLLEDAERMARKAVEAEENWNYGHTLACILASQGKTEEAITLLEELLGEIKSDKLMREDVWELFLQLTANGEGRKVLELLQSSGAADQIEPLIVGIKIFLGENPRVAQEIGEVGKDIAQSIRDKIIKTTISTDL